MFRPDYNGATKLLSKALSSRNIAVPTFDALSDAVLDYFEDNDFYLAAAILGKVTTQKDWHYVEVGLNTSFINSLDPINVADSHASAIGSVLAEIDSAHHYPDAITVNGNAIEFHSNGELMFRIGRVEYTEVDQAMSERCAKLFKGIRRYGENARISKRLQSIPQLESLEHVEFGTSVPHGQPMISMIENFPVFLRTMLSERFGIEIKQSLALEIVAEMFGAKSWHVIKSAADAMMSVDIPITVDVTNGQDNKVSFYRSNSDAIVGFTHHLRNHPQKEQLRVVFHGADISFKAAYISAHNPADDTVHGGITYNTDLICLSTPPEIGLDEPKLASLSWIKESDLNSIVSRLKEVILVERPLMSRLFASSDRRDNKILPIKNYLFTLIVRDELKSTLKVEQFSEDGTKISESFKPAYAATYKAELSITREGVVLIGDYGREVVAKFDGFKEDDLLRLAKFSNIDIRPFTPVTEEIIH